METIELIVECGNDSEAEERISRLGRVKYRLPMINSYVLEIEKSKLHLVNGVKGVKAVYDSKRITAQMNTARKSVNADAAQGRGLTGRGIAIGVLDTGVGHCRDLTEPKDRILVFKDFINGKSKAYDDNGHGTHVTGIIAGNGLVSNGKYMGMAPEANIVSAKVLDEEGRGSTAEVLAGLQWLMDQKELYNIRIINLSVGTPDNGSADPLVRAVEAAWDAGIIVVAAAGNNGPKSSSVTSPGISRKIITVGASDDNSSVTIWGDNCVNFSGRGPTHECIVKPDVLAPGTDIISCLTPDIEIKSDDPEDRKIVAGEYLSLSGTSMSTPIVSGAIALLLQKSPELTPDDVKYMLKKSAHNLNYPINQQGFGLLDVDKLVSMEVMHVRK
jgi:serine protease AprX